MHSPTYIKEHITKLPLKLGHLLLRGEVTWYYYTWMCVLASTTKHILKNKIRLENSSYTLSSIYSGTSKVEPLYCRHPWDR